MKKLILFILIIACLFPTMLEKVETNPLFDMQNVEQVCFISENKFEVDGVESVKSGDLYYNYCSLSIAKANLNEFKKNMKGFQFYFKKEPIENIIQKLKVDILEQITLEDGRNVLCGVTPYYDNYIYMDSKRVNLQISISENEVVVGFPIILTGY